MPELMNHKQLNAWAAAHRRRCMVLAVLDRAYETTWLLPHLRLRAQIYFMRWAFGVETEVEPYAGEVSARVRAFDFRVSAFCAFRQCGSRFWRAVYLHWCGSSRCLPFRCLTPVHACAILDVESMMNMRVKAVEE